MTLRPIEPMKFPDLRPAAIAGTPPVARWVAPTDLFVDDIYQRDLSRKSLKLIGQIYSAFAWNRMKPPIVVAAGSVLHVVDGQHTAIAAASRGIEQILVVVVDAPGIDERARAFVGHNTDRIKVTSIAIYNALRASGDPDALDVERVCKRAGVRIREFTQSSKIEPGDTKAIGIVSNMIRRRGVIKARKALECLAKAGLAPIPGGAIAAVENILCVERPDVDLEALSALIRSDGEAGLGKARAKASGERTPFWRVLSARWLRRLDPKATTA